VRGPESDRYNRELTFGRLRRISAFEVRQAVFMNLRYTRQSTDVFSVLIDGMAKLANLDDNQFQAFRDRLSSLSQPLDPLIYRHAIIIPSSADAAGAQLMGRKKQFLHLSSGYIRGG